MNVPEASGVWYSYLMSAAVSRIDNIDCLTFAQLRIELVVRPVLHIHQCPRRRKYPQVIVATGSGRCLTLGQTGLGRNGLPSSSSEASLAILFFDQPDHFDDRIPLDHVCLLYCKVLCHIRLPWNVVVCDDISLTLIGQCLDKCVKIGPGSIAFRTDEIRSWCWRATGSRRRSRRGCSCARGLVCV